MSFDYSKLRGRITEKYGTATAFAERNGLNYITVIRRLRGITGFSQEDIIQWCQILDINPSDASLYFLQESSKH